MLDQGVSLRCVLVYVAGVCAASAGAAGWVTNDGRFGVLSLTFVIATAVLLVLNDNAKTRRAIRYAMRGPDQREGLTSVH